MNRLMYWLMSRWLLIRLNDEDYDDNTWKLKIHDWIEWLLTWWFGVDPLEPPWPYEYVIGMTPCQAFWAGANYFDLMHKTLGLEVPMTTSIYEWCLPMAHKIAERHHVIVEVLPRGQYDSGRINIRLTPSTELRSLYKNASCKN